jgi:hypothetical protein
VSGCAGKPLNPEAQKTIRTIGIVSSIGDELTMQNVPLFRWDQEEFHHEIAGWEMDDYAVAQIEQRLQDKYTIVPVQYDRAAFDGESIVLDGWKGPAVDGRPIGELVQAHVRGEPADAYLVVVKQHVGAGTSATGGQGFGMFRWPTMLGNLYYAYAGYGIVIVDGRSYEPLAAMEAMDKFETPFNSNFHGKPNHKVTEAYWMEGEGQLSPDKQELLKKEFQLLLGETIPGTLERLKLMAASASTSAP